ncbi:hypothetical protein [Neomegalonema sp.]|uniref:hypothetical protein n=1 Tax=Neomegalonema sp. TaxID=2039713 RepID=UPI00262F1843|nr:hypothetical protein [Neomegalonema sp.]MDD2869068.1 hypothetical protein [Neomegalonema sp.]
MTSPPPGRRRPARAFAAPGLTLCLLALLSACGGASARKNPDFFTARSSGSTLTGVYNPAGFTSEEVRELLKGGCAEERLASYAEAPGSGVASFTAVCDGEAAFGNGHMQFERRAEGGILVEQMGSGADGRLTTRPPRVHP